MLDLLRKLWRRDPPLIRTRSTGRPRTYSADSGYVYTYSFAGFRRLRRSKEAFVEYVFDVTGGREPVSAVTVELAEDRLSGWTGRDRELTASERYAIAKLVLKQALDRFPDPKSVDSRVIPGEREIAEIAETLDL